MAKLLAMGELLIDFTPAGKSREGQPLFAQNPGGAPANVAVQARRCGVSAGFLGRVGKDVFGDFLKNTLASCGVDIRGLSQDSDAKTTLAFVSLNGRGDRSFSFYRDPGADTRLRFEDADLSLIDECGALCFGSLLLTAEPSRSAVYKLVSYARELGKITAYDPNWRPALWRDKDEGIEAMKSLIPLADVMKVSEEELSLLTGEKLLGKAAGKLLSEGVKLVAVTRGAKGCAIFTRGNSIYQPTYDTKVVDTTGSGDSFFGAMLAKLLLSEKRELSRAELVSIADYANAAGSVCASKPGAIPALPESGEIELCRKKTRLLSV